MTVEAQNDSGSGTLVLVADDDPDILSLVSQRLEKSGYGVITAEDGDEAMQALREHRPDLVILDMRMPKLDGIEVIRRIRVDEQSSGIPVIALSARVQDANIAEGLEAGADEYMKKPFSLRQLLELVEAKLSAPRA